MILAGAASNPMPVIALGTIIVLLLLTCGRRKK